MSLITQTELMRKLVIKSRNTIYLWRKEGCPCIQKRKFIRFDFDKVVEWLGQNKRESK